MFICTAGIRRELLTVRKKVGYLYFSTNSGIEQFKFSLMFYLWTMASRDPGSLVLKREGFSSMHG